MKKLQQLFEVGRILVRSEKETANRWQPGSASPEPVSWQKVYQDKRVQSIQNRKLLYAADCWHHSSDYERCGYTGSIIIVNP